MNKALQNLLILAIVFAVALNYPFISIANRGYHSGQLPKLFLHIFLIWLVTIIIAFILVKQKPGAKDE